MSKVVKWGNAESVDTGDDATSAVYTLKPTTFAASFSYVWTDTTEGTVVPEISLDAGETWTSLAVASGIANYGEAAPAGTPGNVTKTVDIVADLLRFVFTQADGDGTLAIRVTESQRGPQGEQGPQGDEGPQGEPGADGESSLNETSGPTALTVGAILDGEALTRSGTAVVGRFSRTVAQSADVTEASSTNPVDITGLTVNLPRAGVYQVSGILPYTAADGTSRTTGFGLVYSGTATVINIAFQAGSSSNRQTVVGTLATQTSDTTTNNYRTFIGQITVTTSGTLKAQFSRSAASLTFTKGVMTVREAT